MGETRTTRTAPRRQVLLIDGAGLLWAAMTEPLRAHGYDARRARSFGESFLLLTEQAFDIVLTCHLVNGRDVQDVVARLREVYRGPLIVLGDHRLTEDNAGALVADVIEADANAADANAAWPREAAEILAQIETTLAHPARDASAMTLIMKSHHHLRAVPRAGEWSCSARSRVITTPDGQRLKLPADAFNVLVCLAGRRGELVTRTELWDACVGTATRPMVPYVLNAAIARLRTSLSPHMAGHPPIRTVFGQGYVFTGFELVEESAAGARDVNAASPVGEEPDGQSSGSADRFELPIISAAVWSSSAQLRTITTPDGQQLKLSANAFNVLVCLARRRGSLVTRSELLEAYTGSATDTSKAYLLGVIVAQLRAILAPHVAEQQPIQTVYGQGYVFTGFELVESALPVADGDDRGDADQTSRDHPPPEYISDPAMARGG